MMKRMLQFTEIFLQAKDNEGKFLQRIVIELVKLSYCGASFMVLTTWGSSSAFRLVASP